MRPPGAERYSLVWNAAGRLSGIGDERLSGGKDIHVVDLEQDDIGSQGAADRRGSPRPCGPTGAPVEPRRGILQDTGAGRVPSRRPYCRCRQPQSACLSHHNCNSGGYCTPSPLMPLSWSLLIRRPSIIDQPSLGICPADATVGPPQRWATFVLSELSMTLIVVRRMARMLGGGRGRFPSTLHAVLGAVSEHDE